MDSNLLEQQLTMLLNHIHDYQRAAEKLRQDEIDITMRFCLPNGEYASGFYEELADRRRQFIQQWSKAGWRNRHFLRKLTEAT